MIYCNRCYLAIRLRPIWNLKSPDILVLSRLNFRFHFHPNNGSKCYIPICEKPVFREFHVNKEFWPRSNELQSSHFSYICNGFGYFSSECSCEYINGIIMSYNYLWKPCISWFRCLVEVLRYTNDMDIILVTISM